MARLPRTIRFDGSDAQVFERAAGPDEWAVSGAFAFADLEAPPVGKQRQAFVNGFLSLESFGRSTFVSVGECPETQLELLTERLAEHLVARYGAPDLAAALPAAEEELGFALELCRGQPVNSLFVVERRFDEEGRIREAFRLVQPPGETPHARVWDVVEDG